jgi:hypothetical protein
VTKKPIKRRRYAEGGAVEPPKPKPKPEPPKRPEPPLGGLGMGDVMRRRQARMDALERGEADPGQQGGETRFARGGKVKAKRK